MITTTFNRYHLGDNLVHLHFLRKLAQKYPERDFAHLCIEQHLQQLRPLVADLPNLALEAFRDGNEQDSMDAWRGAGDFWYKHPRRLDFTAFHFDWFDHLAEKMGLENPIKSAEDLRFDYPALAWQKKGGDAVDYLLINSIPHSGQFRGFNSHDFDNLAGLLIARGHSVVTTAPTNSGASCTHNGGTGLSITAIGSLSRSARVIVGVVTGPFWPCFNIWNTDKRFILLLDDERVNIMPNVEHVRSCAEAEKFL